MLYFNMEVYDRAVIQQAFAGDKPSAISTLKRELLDQVIRYIYAHQPNNGMRDLDIQIGEASFLKAKGQSNLAMQRIELAIRDALSLHALEPLLRAIEVQQSVADALELPYKDRKYYWPLQEETFKAILEQHAVNAVLFQANRLRLRPITEQFEQAVALKAEFEALAPPQHVRNKIKYCKVRFYFARLYDNLETSRQCAEEILAIMDSYPDLLRDPELREEYFNKMSLVIQRLLGDKMYSEAEKVLSRMKEKAEIWSGGVAAEPGMYSRYMYSVIGSKLASRQWQAAQSLVKQVFKDVVQEDLLDSIAMRPAILRIGAFSSFLNRDFSLARKFIIELRKSSAEYGTKKIWLTWTGMIYLLSYVEESDTFLRLAYKDICAWFQAEECTSEYEQVLLLFLKEVCEDEDCKWTSSSLLRFKANLEALAQNRMYNRYFEMFQVFDWIKSKLESLWFRDLVFN